MSFRLNSRYCLLVLLTACTSFSTRTFEERAPATENIKIEPQACVDQVAFVMFHNDDVQGIRGMKSFSYARTDRSFRSILPRDFSTESFVLSLKGKRVLDLGCGDGAAVEELRARKIDATGIDLYLSKEQKKHSYFVQADVFHATPEQLGGQFDFIYSSFSVFFYELELALYKKAFVQTLGLLKKGGTLFIHETSPERVKDLAKSLPDIKILEVESADPRAKRRDVWIQKL